jgi:predicted nucleic acid-binding protein|tara:strand:- start:69 stop:743 length:675 start_codon:yes stop_codon:yes gene_type:complete
VIAVFDTSSLISMSQSCLIASLKGLRNENENTFVIPESVYGEVVERPLKIKRFELNAVRVQKAVDEGWLEVKELNAPFRDMANKIADLANNMFFIKGKRLKLIQAGEIEALALLKQLNSNLLIIDERTTRAILESPMQLKRLIERRRNKKVNFKEENAAELKEMFPELDIARSVDLVALAFERKLLGEELPQSKQALEAALYAVKYAGCAVSGNEIERFLGSKK